MLGQVVLGSCRRDVGCVTVNNSSERPRAGDAGFRVM